MSLPPALPKRKRPQKMRPDSGSVQEGALRPNAFRENSNVLLSGETAHSSQVSLTSTNDSPSATASRPRKKALHTRHSVTSVSSSHMHSSLKRLSALADELEFDKLNNEYEPSAATSDDAFTNEANDEPDFGSVNLFNEVENVASGFSKKQQKRDKNSKVRI
jgi:hypothetical protein